MAKDFTKKLKKEPTKVAAVPEEQLEGQQEIVDTDMNTTEVKKVAAVPKAADEKKKPGRPKTKTEPEKTINIAVPISVLEKVDIALAKYQGNLTKYVNEVIRKDLEQNFSDYQQIYDLMNK